MKMSTDRKVLVSIGIPVYNGESFLARAIQSILDQEYPNLEILISDNASTDGTEKICREFLEKDQRIRYHRFDKNRGATANFRKTFEMAKGTYFKWAAHDDILGKSYISKCVDYLEKNNDTGLCHCYTYFINEQEEITDNSTHDQIEYENGDSYLNYRTFLKRFRFGQDDAGIINGVFRRSVLAQTNLLESYNSSDLTLMANLVLMTRIKIIPEYHFYKRRHLKNSTQANKNNKSWTRFFDTSKKKTEVPLMIWYRKFNQYVYKSNLTVGQKLMAYAATVQWLNFRLLKGIKRRVTEKLGFTVI
jgi:glycosyltransferase involved in cell wall biosynthesis